jgi:hypothetical protein
LLPFGVNPQLIKRKAWGCLTFASEDVENVCFETENYTQLEYIVVSLKNG